MRNVSLSFGDKKILSDFSYDFNKGDRIGIVGRNGVGKVSQECSVYLTKVLHLNGLKYLFGLFETLLSPHSSKC